MSPGARSAAATATPASSRTGRRLTYCWKLAPDRDQQPPERDVVRHAGIADRAEKDGIVGPQLVEPVLRHHPAGLGVGLAAPVEFVPLEAEAVGPRRRLHRGNALRHHLAPDAVAGDHRDPILLCHGPILHAAARPRRFSRYTTNPRDVPTLRRRARFPAPEFARGPDRAPARVRRRCKDRARPDAVA